FIEFLALLSVEFNILRLASSTLFPYSTLFRSCATISSATFCPCSSLRAASTTFIPLAANARAIASPMPLLAPVTTATLPCTLSRDRKSTRLSFSHVWISYTVFCVKKKQQQIHT